MPRRDPKIDVCFKSDSNGILNAISALERSTKREITITNLNGHSEDQIRQMSMNARRYNAYDHSNKSRIIAKHSLENYCNFLRTTISSPEVEGMLSVYTKTMVERAIDETLSWLDVNFYAGQEVYENRQSALEEFSLPILQATIWDIE